MKAERILTLDIRMNRGVVILFTLVLLVIALALWAIRDSDYAVASGLSAPQASSTGMRQYYLTTTWYDGVGADSACASGYHMASLWEINEPAYLKYNPILGYTRADSGLGPPAYAGWVRTGYASSSVNVAGEANCSTWSSASNTDYGTWAGLPYMWTMGSNVHVWNVGTSQCNLPRSVWCVED